MSTISSALLAPIHFDDDELLYSNNNYPPDNLVVFHRRADISPLLPAALIKGEMRTTACFCP